jgi:hypothetical protein
MSVQHNGSMMSVFLISADQPVRWLARLTEKHHFIIAYRPNKFSASVGDAASCNKPRVYYVFQNEEPIARVSIFGSRLCVKPNTCRRTELNWTELASSVQFSSVRRHVMVLQLAATRANWLATQFAVLNMFRLSSRQFALRPSSR